MNAWHTDEYPKFEERRAYIVRARHPISLLHERYPKQIQGVLAEGRSTKDPQVPVVSRALFVYASVCLPFIYYHTYRQCDVPWYYVPGVKCKNIWTCSIFSLLAGTTGGHTGITVEFKGLYTLVFAPFSRYPQCSRQT